MTTLLKKIESEKRTPLVLSDFIKIKHGFAFKGEDFSSKPTKDVLVTPGNFSIGGGFKDDKFKYYDGPVSDDYILKQGDLVVTMTDLSVNADTLGYSALVPNDGEHRFLHNQRVGLVQKINDDEVIDLGYLYYLMRTREYQSYVVSTASGSTVRHTSPDRISAYEYKFPNLATQKKIAEILGAYDAKIENNSTIIKKLELMAQTLFNEWFVNFKFPGVDKVKFIYSETGEIPEGWKVGKFTEYISVLGGGTPPTGVQEYWNGEIPFFTPKDADAGFYCLSTEKNITNLGLSNCSSQLYPTNTVFITARGTVGKLALSGVPMAMNQSCYALQGKRGMQSFFVMLLTQNLIKELQQVAIGGVFDTITTSTFENTEILIPEDHLIEKFHTVISPLFQKILSLNLENQALIRSRDQLLIKLV